MTKVTENQPVPSLGSRAAGAVRERELMVFSRQPHLDGISLVYFLPHSEQREA